MVLSSDQRLSRPVVDASCMLSIPPDFPVWVSYRVARLRSHVVLFPCCRQIPFFPPLSRTPGFQTWYDFPARTRDRAMDWGVMCSCWFHGRWVVCDNRGPLSAAARLVGGDSVCRCALRASPVQRGDSVWHSLLGGILPDCPKAGLSTCTPYSLSPHLLLIQDCLLTFCFRVPFLLASNRNTRYFQMLLLNTGSHSVSFLCSHPN